MHIANNPWKTRARVVFNVRLNSVPFFVFCFKFNKQKRGEGFGELRGFDEVFKSEHINYLYLFYIETSHSCAEGHLINGLLFPLFRWTSHIYECTSVGYML